ncbi:MAG TPA: hypothetical protein VK550_12175 [Polyangiaceae bacterium]|nr:hypothetical protein [Polyangiaceae bacterium]
MKPKKLAKASARRRKFVVYVSVEVEIDQRLLDSVLTDEWRAQMFPFYKPEEVASHLVFNLIQGTPLTSIDGYADQDPERVKMGHIDTDETVEINDPKPTPRPRTKRVANDRRSKNR